MDIYADLLSSVGITMPLEEKPQQPISLPFSETCPECQAPFEEWGPIGDYGCWDCGILSKHPQYATTEMEYQQERTSYGKIIPKGLKSQITYTKRRGYNPLTHFKEHLRRYMGYRFSLDPETKSWKEFPADLKKLMTESIQLNAPDAYFQARKVLKKYPKGAKYYKDVFQLIYECGGQRPEISQQLFDKCVRHFMNFQYKFLRLREEYNRHNLPCYYMILELILKQQGHQPHYEFPHLKDELLKEKITDIFQEVNNKCF